MKGDTIQFCRDFQGLSFRSACGKVQKDPVDLNSRLRHEPNPAPTRVPTSSWEEKAKIFVEKSVQRLLIDRAAIELLFQRGLTLDSIEKNRLGWNSLKLFYRRTDWGLEETEERQWVCLPAGLVIPIFEGKDIRKLKIRKSEWKEGDFYGKYYEVPGSSPVLSIFGSLSNEIVIIVESEFDAMLVVQEAGDLCACIALGGAQKRPHPFLHEWLLNRKLILFALDFDEAGKKEYAYWHKSYPNLEPWPIPEEKSPGDYFSNGGSLRKWILSGLQS
jgi:DNA primase